MLQTTNSLPRCIWIKWHGIMAPILKVEIGNVSKKTLSTKGRAFDWSIWNKVIVVNSWRAQFIRDINDKCLMCSTNIPDSIAHRFRDCKIAHKIWDFSIGIVNIMKAKPGEKDMWRPLDWQRMILRKKVPATIFCGKFSRVCYSSEESRCGLFGWRGMISPSITMDGR